MREFAKHNNITDDGDTVLAAAKDRDRRILRFKGEDVPEGILIGRLMDEQFAQSKSPAQQADIETAEVPVLRNTPIEIVSLPAQRPTSNGRRNSA